MEPQIVLRLIVREDSSDESIALWVKELATLAASGTSCVLEMNRDEQAAAWEHRCRDAHIELRKPGSGFAVSDGQQLVVAEAAAHPGPRVIKHLTDALVARPGSAVIARRLPLEDGRGRQAVVALDANAMREVIERQHGATDPLSASPAPLVAAARAAGVGVEMAAAATVYHHLRVALVGDDGDDLGVRSAGRRVARVYYGDPMAIAADEAEHEVALIRPSGHPAALNTSIGLLLEQLGLDRPKPDTTPRPFLTVVTRTQGRRLQCLAETLTSLAAQTVRDFEVLLACHRVTERELKGVERLIEDLPTWLSERVQIMRVERNGRSAPLNDAFAAARGRYAVILDDDDTVLSHWVETFRDLEEHHAGKVLRSVAVRQDVEGVEVAVDGGSVMCPVAVMDPLATWPGRFRFVDHLFGNFSPCMTVAFPRGAFSDLGERFDEDLHTTEDWEYLMRVSSLVGVGNAPVVTSVYRWWTEGDSSRSVHDKAEWDRTRDEILHIMEKRLIILPQGNARRVDEMNTEIHHAWYEIGVAADASKALNDRLVHTIADHTRLSGLLSDAMETTRRLTATTQHLARTVERQEATVARLRRKRKGSAGGIG